MKKFVLIYLVLLVPSGLRADLATLQDELHEVITKASKSTVYIGGGTGVIVTDKKYVLTNYHVIKKQYLAGTDALVRVPSVGEFNARILGVDALNYGDSALLEFRDQSGLEKVPSMEIGSSDDLQIGQWVFTLGSPYNIAGRGSPSASLGVVSSMNLGTRAHYDDGVQTDASINPGNSGGPLVNLRGELVGIAGKHKPRFAIRTSTGQNFAVGSSRILRLLERMKRGETLYYHTLEGLETAPDPEGGVNIKNVIKGSPADKMGFKKSDVIKTVAGIDTMRGTTIHTRLAAFDGGEPVEVDVLREGKPMTKKVVLSNAWTLEDDEAVLAYVRHMMNVQLRSDKYARYEIYDPSSEKNLKLVFRSVDEAVIDEGNNRKSVLFHYAVEGSVRHAREYGLYDIKVVVELDDQSEGKIVEKILQPVLSSKVDKDEQPAARGLRSDDWEKRYRAVQELRASGATANDVVLPVLKDKNEVVRKAAQNHFISLGEIAVPYLVERLVETGRDEGFFARIAGGTERSEVKSLAGTLWLTLARGTPRDRCFEITRGLISHHNAKVRAVGLFTAASMREAKFLRLLKPIARDRDPMVRERFWESLVLLLVKRSRSAPDLDEATSALTLSFLEPELVPLLNSEQLGALERAQTYGDVLTRADLHPKLRHRFLAMLEQTLGDDRLSAGGAVHAGAIIARQHGEDDRGRAFRDRVKRLELEKKVASARRQLAALSAFPSSSYDLPALPRLLDFADGQAAEQRVEARGLPMLAANFVLCAIAEGDEEAAHRATASLTRWIAHDDVRFSLEAASAHAKVLAEIETIQKSAAEGPGDDAKPDACEEQRRAVVASAARHADELFARAPALALWDVYQLLRLFVHIGDQRYLDLFDIVWAHRWDDEPEMNSIVSGAVNLLARRKDKAILARILDCAENPQGEWHRSLRDLCAYSLAGSSRYGSFVPDFLTKERFERWVEIIENPELYPRTRAGFFAMLEQESLPAGQKKVLADLALKYTTAPHDSNLRSKAILSLAYSGDRRVLAPLSAMAREADHPWWIWENIVPALAALHGAPRASRSGGAAEGPVPRKAMEVLVALLEDQVATMKPHDEVRLAYPNNYYSWGIEYRYHPPDMTVFFLKLHTRQDFGMDAAKWRDWLSGQGEILQVGPPPDAAAAEEQVDPSFQQMAQATVESLQADERFKGFDFEVFIARPFVVLMTRDPEADRDANKEWKDHLDPLAHGIWRNWLEVRAAWELRSTREDTLENPEPFVWLAFHNKDTYDRYMNKAKPKRTPGSRAYYDTKTQFLSFHKDPSRDPSVIIIHETFHQLMDRFSKIPSTGYKNYCFTEGLPEHYAGHRGSGESLVLGELTRTRRIKEIRELHTHFDDGKNLCYPHAERRKQITPDDWIFFDVPMLLTLRDKMWVLGISRALVVQFGRSDYKRRDFCKNFVAGGEVEFHSALYAFSWAFTYWLNENYPDEYRRYAKIVLNTDRGGDAETFLEAFDIRPARPLPDIQRLVGPNNRDVAANQQEAVACLDERIAILRQTPAIRKMHQQLAEWMRATFPKLPDAP